MIDGIFKMEYKNELSDTLHLPRINSSMLCNDYFRLQIQKIKLRYQMSWELLKGVERVEKLHLYGESLV